MKVPSASQGPRTLDRKDHSLGSTGVPQDKRAQPSKATATLAWGCTASLGAGRGQPAATWARCDPTLRTNAGALPTYAAGVA